MEAIRNQQIDEALRTFRDLNRELADLRSIASTLNWDQETTMPPAGTPFRANQDATLATLYHQKLTSPQYGAILEQLEEEELDEWNRVSLREARRAYDKATRVPEALVGELAETCSMAYEAWVEARQKSDLAHFSPWLEKIIHLKRQQAHCLVEGDVPYDAMLDEYEPKMTVARLDPLLDTLRPLLTELVERIRLSPHQPDKGLLRGRFTQERQLELGTTVITAMGFDWKAGRLDVSPHPFCCGLNPGDVRITTRYSEEDFSVGFFGIVHEAGHALYEQGLQAERFGEPACETISLGVHESQSRLWEIFVGRSRPFWEYWFPRLIDAFPESFASVALEDFLHAVNQVEPSLIRVDADEVTYGLHVILRYEIEKALFEDSLEIRDVEGVWNQKMEEYLGLTPPDAARGVLQDVHWSHGLFGYFPTYLLGTLYASQLFQQAREDIPDLETQIARGEMLQLLEWLRQKVHRHGKRYSADELLRQVTGRAPDAACFLEYLNRKYSELYRLE